MPETPQRLRSTLVVTLIVWALFYASFTLFHPALLDDADSVHVEVAREMLVRHDYVTLYANGIRYLEKAPLFYWSMAASMKAAMLAGVHDPRTLAAAARIPLALTVLMLALLLEAFARRMFRRPRAGLYAVLILLSSFGIFIFTRITIPDAMVCLWIALAMYCFWRTEELDGTASHPASARKLKLLCFGFAAACALNVLTKGLIGVVFPVASAGLYLWITRGWRRGWARVRLLCPWSSLAVFLAIAAPWHVLAGLANPTQGHPAPFRFVEQYTFPVSLGHWVVPMPTAGNVRGWWWFYFMNEHVLRYLNLRVPHDYDTVPLVLFWGLCLVWMMPWSAFAFKAFGWAAPWSSEKWRGQLRRHDFPLRERGRLLLVVWAAFVLLFFSLSTRQEYYVLPALPAIALLLAGWLSQPLLLASRVDGETNAAHTEAASQRLPARAARRCTMVLVLAGVVFAAASVVFLVLAKTPPPGTDLADLLRQNPGEYAMSFGHFLDLDTRALGLFRVPLTLAAVSLFAGPLAAYLLQRRARMHAANLALAAGAFGFLLAAHLGLQTFAPVLSSAQLAEAIRPQVHADDIIAIHDEYEQGSTLGFYLQRSDLHIVHEPSSNLWYGSFFPDAPKIFETPESIAAKWRGPRRVFLWQSLTDQPNTLPRLDGPVYVIARSGGKEIVSNRP